MLGEVLLNFLQKIVNYAPEITIIVVGLLGVFKSYMRVSKLSKQEKVEAAMKVIKEELLSLMSNAELEWKRYKKAGDLKRSKVLTDIYTQFPFLATYIDQDTLCEKIYSMIESEMDTMNRIIKSKDSNEVGKLPDNHDVIVE